MPELGMPDTCLYRPPCRYAPVERRPSRTSAFAAWFGTRHEYLAHEEVNAAHVLTQTQATGIRWRNHAIEPLMASNDRRKAVMQRHRNTGTPPPPPPRPSGSWLAGMMIGATIMTLATQAMVFGAGAAAISNATSKGR
jgi:hypothetical protein